MSKQELEIMPILATNDQAKKWYELSESGTLLGLRILLGIYKIFGRWIFTLILYPVIGYFVLRRPSARRASKDFLNTHFQFHPAFWSRPPSLRHVLRHFMNFGQGILDKSLAWVVPISEDEFQITDPVALAEFHNDPRGQLIIGSHHGNLEFCRGYLTRYKQHNINILIHDKHASNFVEIMRRINADSRLNVYQVANLDVGTILELKAKIDQGEWLFIAGDRVPLSGHSNTTTVDFMGRKARLPIGPYLLAKSLECPVKMVFAYRHQGKIIIDVEFLTDKLEINRKQRPEQLQQCVQQFATALEQRAVRVPYEWFNFYDFWEHQPEIDH